MKPFLILALVVMFVGTYAYEGSTTAPVAAAGGVVAAKRSDTPQVKYKRKDCPVCKGKGYYISGDGIKKIECPYCEPEKGEEPQPTPKSAHPDPSCKNCPPVIRRWR
jgi:DnaJ-class molecular chaperone